MKILSIDTSSNICAVAVLEDTKLLKEISQNNGLTHSQMLMPMMKNILEDLNLKLENIDLIVCDKGPGSFTGIRIGVATAKGFSDSLNIQSLGISSLETLAYNVQEDGIICPLIDAKNNNVYYGLFEKSQNNYISVSPLSFENISDVLNNLAKLNKPITFVGDGAQIYKSTILKNISYNNFVGNNNISAYNLGLAGFSHFKNGQKEVLLPLYLRKPQAERTLEVSSNGK